MASITNKVLNGNDGSYTINTSWTDRFIKRGQRMYMWKAEDMIDIFTKEELKTVFNMFGEAKNFTKANILKVPFRKATADMKPVARSRLKKKC